tara:strand:+ start:14764 stop:15561 length:798 start_codon:yes stop_codon:yes gene_type:complete
MKTLPTVQLLLLLLMLAVTGWSCGAGATDEAAPCLLESVHYDERNSLRFLTISGGRVYQLTQEYIDFEGETDIVHAYSFVYYQDSIAVKDVDFPTAKYPYISVRSEEDQIQKIVRYSPTAGVQLFHHFDHSDENILRIDMSRIASTGHYLYFGYALYHFNEEGNVVRGERYRIDFENPEDDSLYKIEDRYYTYDTRPNPYQGLLIPFFSTIDFPDPRYFSENNVMREEQGSEYAGYQYEYGAQGNVRIQYLPDGNQTRFDYLNCE